MSVSSKPSTGCHSAESNGLLSELIRTTLSGGFRPQTAATAIPGEAPESVTYRRLSSELRRMKPGNVKPVIVSMISAVSVTSTTDTVFALLFDTYVRVPVELTATAIEFSPVKSHTPCMVAVSITDSVPVPRSEGSPEPLSPVCATNSRLPSALSANPKGPLTTGTLVTDGGHAVVSTTEIVLPNGCAT